MPTGHVESLRQAPRLDPLETGSGVVYGPRRGEALDLSPRRSESPREALERLLLGALERAPCVVAFSGGRDSSAILAEATRVAREHGLDLPIPHTMRFSDAPRTAEGEWQEMTIRHLGLREWSRQTVSAEFDALGPEALKVLAEVGVHWPANLHSFQFLFGPAAGGSLLTGNGGDELFTAWPGHRIARLRRARGLPRAGELRQLVRHSLPPPLLGEWWMRRGRLGLAWLRRAAGREVAKGLAADSMTIAPDWRSEIELYLNSRYVELITGFATALGEGAEVRLVQPFLEPEYVRAVCEDAPPMGYPSRTAAMGRLFGDVLPQEVHARGTKAIFSEAFFGPELRRFAVDWSGEGVDEDLVDADALRAEWLKPKPQFCSLVPLQKAWSNDH